MGTDNEELLNDDAYLGYRQARLRGPAYFELLDEFVAAVAEVFPGAVVQWEDFRKDNALAVLHRYDGQIASFNDDIQGTGAIAVASVLSAARRLGQSLTDQRIIIYGAGAAGLGKTQQLRAAMIADGATAAAARQRLQFSTAAVFSLTMFHRRKPTKKSSPGPSALPRRTALAIQPEKPCWGHS